MKKLLLINLLITAVFSLYAGTYSGGTGTESDPYLIANLNDLEELSNTPADWGSGIYFLQTANIDAAATSSWNNGEGFSPIGNGDLYSDPMFKGNYNGQNFVIKHLYINRPDSSLVGFFGSCESAVLNNISIETGTISGFEYIGGITGYCLYSTIQNCSFSGSVNGDNFIGGIVGFAYNSSFSNSNASGSVNGSGSNAGGLIGSIRKCNITDSWFIGDVYSDRRVGGLVGASVNQINIHRCFSEGTVTGNKWTGGLIGTHANDTGIYEYLNIYNSYSRSNVSGNDYVGGLLGYKLLTHIFDSYSTGKVEGNTHVGGLVGGYSSTYYYQTSCWDMVSSGCLESYGGTGRTTIEMKNQSTFTSLGWNFTDTWIIKEAINDGYPILRAHDYYSRKPEGLGTHQNPYLVENHNNLSWMQSNPSGYDTNFYFVQTMDIISPAEFQNKPIGDETLPFKANYNGMGHTIKNLIVEGENNTGFFGYIDEGIVQNLGLVNITVNGQDNVGGVAGYCTGGALIQNTFCTGNIYGNNKTGGFAGSIESSELNNTFSRADVSGNSYTGGLVGRLLYNGNITNSYSAGSVAGNTITGGLCGESSSSASISNSFWDTEVSGQSNSSGGEGKTTEEMKTEITFTEAGWDFSETWEIYENINNDYPFLRNANSPTPVTPDGNGTDENPYQIASTENLLWMSQTPEVWGNESYFVQTMPIDAYSTKYYYMGAGFSPIGNSTLAFEGNYNGNGYKIKNLYVYRPDEHYIGLFGYIKNAKISNIELDNTNITGNTFTGSLVGTASNSTLSIIRCVSGSVSGRSNVGGLFGKCFNSSQITNTSFEGEVSGNNTIGGLIGYLKQNSILKSSWSSGIIFGNDFGIGGLVGSIYGVCDIIFCNSSVEVTGDFDIGGLVGEMRENSTISQSYSTGEISGNRRVGGLVGYTYQGTEISNSYSRCNVSGETSVGGVVGSLGSYNYSSSYISKTYSTGLVSGNNETGGCVGLKNYSYLYDCFWDIETSGQTTSDGGIGKNTEEMKTKSTFTDEGWDFAYTWEIIENENDGYPLLRYFVTLDIDENPVAADKLNIYAHGQNIYLKPVDGPREGMLSISDIAGRIIFKKEMKLYDKTSISLNVIPGVYIVSFTGGNDHAVKKVIL